MDKKLTLDELLNEAIALWNKEGMDPTDSDSPLYKLHEDPISKLLLGAVNYQSNSIFDDITAFRNDLAEVCLDMAAPFYLNSPRPSIAMLQTAKGHVKGAKNHERTVLDGNIAFVFSKEVGTKRHTIPFMPLLSVAIMDLSLRSVEKVSRNRWRLEIEDMEDLNTLDGLSIYFPNIDQMSIVDDIHKRVNLFDEKILVYAGDVQLPVSNISDFDSLPFSSPFLKSMAFSRNSLQCNVLQNIQDSFCCLANSYCVVNGMDKGLQIPKHDGCFVIDVELPFLDNDVKMSVNDILLNCVPVINVEMHSTELSHNNPIQPVETGDSFFLTTLAPDNLNENDSFVLRTVATERESPAQWIKNMERLLNQYNAQYNVMEYLLDDNLKKVIQPFISSLKQCLDKNHKNEEGLYLILKNRMPPSLNAQWLSTSGTLANDFNKNSKIQCSTSELDSEQTHLVTKSSGGRNPITDPLLRQQAMRYYQVSRDRIISKSDIVSFCRFKLSSMFAVKSDEIEEIRIYDTIRNSSEGFFERILVADIKLRKGCIDTKHASLALERMIRFRTASTTPIRVIISN